MSSADILDRIGSGIFSVNPISLLIPIIDALLRFRSTLRLVKSYSNWSSDLVASWSISSRIKIWTPSLRSILRIVSERTLSAGHPVNGIIGSSFCLNVSAIL